MTMSRSAVSAVRRCAAAVAVGLACGCAAGGASAVAHATGTATARAGARSRIDGVIRAAIRAHDLHAVIAQVTIGGKPVLTRAYGTSMTGVPATVQMHFRNGGVAVSYMSTLLLRLVDQGTVSLDDPVSDWLPHLRDASHVTLGELAAMTAGYHDYVLAPGLGRGLYENPFARVTTHEQLRLMLEKPLQFTPGTNWSYSHSDYVVLGQALQKITRQPLAVALRRQVLNPLRLTNTVASLTPAIPAPVLHAYTSERREALGIKPGVPFLEDSTFWNPSWTLAHGAIETSDIVDMTRTAIGIGSGSLLSRASYRLQINPKAGFGHPQAGCERCATLSAARGYGMGVFRKNGWIYYNPSFGGYGAVEAYLPSRRISIAVVTTFREGSFAPNGDITNWAQDIFDQLAETLAPGQ
jgi:CubicO group peptidase (beta-lactamase class C family)